VLSFAVVFCFMCQVQSILSVIFLSTEFQHLCCCVENACLYVCRLVDSPNVLKLLGQCVETAPYLTVLELCSLVSEVL